LEIFKEIIWTKRALSDLRKAYDFNTEIYGEAKSFAIVQRIISKVELLQDLRFEKIGLIDEDFQHLNYEYRKITLGYLKVNYRVGFDNTRVYINRIFDTRQNPKKYK